MRRPCQSAPCRAPRLHRLSQLSASARPQGRSSQCGVRIERRAQTSPGLSPWPLHLAPVSGRRLPCPAARQRLDGRHTQAHIWWSEAQSKHGNLLNGPQDEPAAHMAASLRTPGSHPIRLAAYGTWSSSSAAKGVMRTSRLVADKLGAVRPDPDLHGLLFLY